MRSRRLRSARVMRSYDLGSATSARAANRTEVTAESSPTLAGRAGRRLDTKTGERLQTVMVWPAAEADRVNVVITNDLPDPKIQAAVDAFGDG